MRDEPTTDTGPAPRIEVVGGGPVPAEDLAAVVVALTPVPPADGGDRPAQAPAWARAALLEGVGLPRPARPSDLRSSDVLGS